MNQSTKRRPGRCIRVFGGRPHDIESICFSPDGKCLATRDSEYFIRVWDVATRKERFHLSADGASYTSALAFSPDGQRLAAGCSGHTVQMWEAATGKLKRLGQRGKPGDGITAVAFSPDSTVLAVASRSKTVSLLAVDTGKETDALTGSEDIASLAFSPNGKLLAVGSHLRGNSRGTVADPLWVWDLASRKPSFQLGKRLGHGGFQSLVFSPDGRTLIGGGDRTIQTWKVANGKEARVIADVPADIRALAASADGRMLATAHDDGVRLWETSTGTVRNWYKGHFEERVNAVAFSPDGKTLVSGGRDDTILFWPIGESPSP